MEKDGKITRTWYFSAKKKALKKGLKQYKKEKRKKIKALLRLPSAAISSNPAPILAIASIATPSCVDQISVLYKYLFYDIVISKK